MSWEVDCRILLMFAPVQMTWQDVPQGLHCLSDALPPNLRCERLAPRKDIQKMATLPSLICERPGNVGVTRNPEA